MQNFLRPLLFATYQLSVVMSFHSWKHSIVATRTSVVQRSFARVSIFDRFDKSRYLLTGLFAGKGMAEKDPGAVKGTNLKVLKYPHPKLRAENEVVSLFDASVSKIAQEMLLVMYASQGIGLAAPQVGINKRVMVFNEKGDPKFKDLEMILINPRIVAKSDEQKKGEEGCLSFPDINGDVERSIWIEVEYQKVDGSTVQIKFEGKPAVIFQHEYDHLDKVLFIDRLAASDKESNQRKLEKLIRKYGPGGAL